MKVREAIARLDAARPNAVDTAVKIGWLSTADHYVKKEIIDTHEGWENIEFSGYGTGDLDAELLVPEPYCELYVYLMEARMQYDLGDMMRYSNAMSLYNQSMQEFARWYNATHMPLSVPVIYR